MHGPCSAFVGPRHLIRTEAHLSVPNVVHSSLTLCLQPDWDMFHSKHPAALLHATARVVSGGGIYVSDKPGAHDVDLLQRLVLPNGCVIRPQLPGRPTQDILFADVLKDNKTLLKVHISLRLLVCSTCCAGISNCTCFCFCRKSLNVCTRTVSVCVCVCVCVFV